MLTWRFCCHARALIQCTQPTSTRFMSSSRKPEKSLRDSCCFSSEYRTEFGIRGRNSISFSVVFRDRLKRYRVAYEGGIACSQQSWCFRSWSRRGSSSASGGFWDSLSTLTHCRSVNNSERWTIEDLSGAVAKRNGFLYFAINTQNGHLMPS